MTLPHVFEVHKNIPNSWTSGSVVSLHISTKDSFAHNLTRVATGGEASGRARGHQGCLNAPLSIAYVSRNPIDPPTSV